MGLFCGTFQARNYIYTYNIQTTILERLKVTLKAIIISHPHFINIVRAVFYFKKHIFGSFLAKKALFFKIFSRTYLISPVQICVANFVDIDRVMFS